MYVSFNYTVNLVYINGSPYDLDSFRVFLLRQFEDLCKKHFIKNIQVKGRRIMTYDWDGIFSVAKESVLPIEQFLKHDNSFN